MTTRKADNELVTTINKSEANASKLQKDRSSQMLPSHLEMSTTRRNSSTFASNIRVWSYCRESKAPVASVASTTCIHMSVSDRNWCLSPTITALDDAMAEAKTDDWSMAPLSIPATESLRSMAVRYWHTMKPRLLDTIPLTYACIVLQFTSYQHLISVVSMLVGKFSTYGYNVNFTVIHRDFHTIQNNNSNMFDHHFNWLT